MAVLRPHSPHVSLGADGLFDYCTADTGCPKERILLLASGLVLLRPQSHPVIEIRAFRHMDPGRSFERHRRPGRGRTVFPRLSAPENLPPQGLGAPAEHAPVLDLSFLFALAEPGKDPRFAAGSVYHPVEKKHLSRNDPALLVEHHRHAAHGAVTLQIIDSPPA